MNWAEFKKRYWFKKNNTDYNGTYEDYVQDWEDKNERFNDFVDKMLKDYEGDYQDSKNDSCRHGCGLDSRCPCEFVSQFVLSFKTNSIQQSF